MFRLLAKQHIVHAEVTVDQCSRRLVQPFLQPADVGDIVFPPGIDSVRHLIPEIVEQLRPADLATHGHVVCIFTVGHGRQPGNVLHLAPEAGMHLRQEIDTEPAFFQSGAFDLAAHSIVRDILHQQKEVLLLIQAGCVNLWTSCAGARRQVPVVADFPQVEPKLLRHLTVGIIPGGHLDDQTARLSNTVRPVQMNGRHTAHHADALRHGRKMKAGRLLPQAFGNPGGGNVTQVGGNSGHGVVLVGVWNVRLPESRERGPGMSLPDE